MNTAELSRVCRQVRRDIINMTANAGSGHPGGSLSATELMTTLFFRQMRIDPKNPKEAFSFDLLFRGLEVTTGGQRIHDYDQQVQKMLDRGMHPEEFRDFLTIHQHGMPPHGGLGIGLERLTMKLCGLENVREASLFPRDQSRLEP